MISIFIILFCVLILNHLINNTLIKMKNIEVSDVKSKYVNKHHKYGERILYFSSMIVMVLSIMEFHHLRLFIFIGPAMLFAYRAIMKWKYEKENKTYLLSAVTCGSFVISAIVFGTL